MAVRTSSLRLHLTRPRSDRSGVGHSEQRREVERDSLRQLLLGGASDFTEKDSDRRLPMMQ